MFFASRGSARFNWDSFALLLVWRSLLWCDDKSSWHRNIFSAQHRWPDFWLYIYCFVQSGEAFTVNGNKHTHTYHDTNFYHVKYEANVFKRMFVIFLSLCRSWIIWKKLKRTGFHTPYFTFHFLHNSRS